MMLWNEISTEQELHNFLEEYGGFHDCCLKELRYISGAFVNGNLGMHPVNDRRTLYIIFQKQCEDATTIEMEFSSLVKLNLIPVNELYTCEILDASMFFENGRIYWGDSVWFKEQRELYSGTWLCAEKVKWRILNECIGNEEIYSCK